MATDNDKVLVMATPPECEYRKQMLFSDGLKMGLNVCLRAGEDSALTTTNRRDKKLKDSRHQHTFRRE
jgi:hypothetical protein